jgi:hypothetical protein
LTLSRISEKRHVYWIEVRFAPEDDALLKESAWSGNAPGVLHFGGERGSSSFSRTFRGRGKRARLHEARGLGRCAAKYAIAYIAFIYGGAYKWRKAGIGALIVPAIFEEIEAKAPKAIERVRRSLPAAFPEEIAASIIAGFESRLNRLDGAKTGS